MPPHTNHKHHGEENIAEEEYRGKKAGNERYVQLGVEAEGEESKGKERGKKRSGQETSQLAEVNTAVEPPQPFIVSYLCLASVDSQRIGYLTTAEYIETVKVKILGWHTWSLQGLSKRVDASSR